MVSFVTFVSFVVKVFIEKIEIPGFKSHKIYNNPENRENLPAPECYSSRLLQLTLFGDKD